LDRCLRRHGVSNLRALIPTPEGSKQAPQKFKDYELGFVHADIKYLPQMPDEPQHRYLFVAIERTTRWVYMEIMGEKSAANAAGFVERMVAKAPFKVHKILTDNGKEFTDRFCTTGERTPTGNHVFDRVCKRNGIEHRLIKPRHPQTNGMVERFNGRIGEVLATRRFDSSKSLEATLKRYVEMYNYQIPQRRLGHIAPVQALKDWQKKRPELFNKPVSNPGQSRYVAYFPKISAKR
jgi:IS30 family transposase